MSDLVPTRRREIAQHLLEQKVRRLPLRITRARGVQHPQGHRQPPLQTVLLPRCYVGPH